jgi:molybdopterin/thiamine biosynthesis adenylyltransferase
MSRYDSRPFAATGEIRYNHGMYPDDKQQDPSFGPPKTPDLSRYVRQTGFKPFGLEGQEALVKSSALIVGIGGLGSWVAELLVRAGVGRVRLVDNDRVEIANIHRQSLYTEADAAARSLKIAAAAQRLRQINSGARIETICSRLDQSTAESLMQDMDVIVDGMDNFESRLIVNDCAVKLSKPWVFAGVLGMEAQVMTIVPGKTPCLRCLMDAPPAPQGDGSGRGVLGVAVAVTAAFEASEALKVLSGHLDRANRCLLVFDLWENTIRQIDVSTPRADCPCCVHRRFEFLDAPRSGAS